MKLDIKKLLPITTVFVLAFMLASYCLQYNPSSWFDEGIYIQVANNLADQDRLAIQTAPGVFEPLALISVGYPVYYAVGAFYTFLGTSFIHARYTMVLFLMLFIAFFYLLNKKMFNKKSAILSTLLLITFAPLYGNGRNVLGEIPGLFFMTAGLLAFLNWEKSEYKKTNMAIYSGLGFGLAMATKPNFLVLGGGILIAIILARKQIIKQLKNFGLFFGAGTLALGYWVFTQFPSIDVIKRVLEHYANPYARNDVQSLFGENFLRFFTESTPLHFTLLGFILVGALIIKHKKGNKISGTEWIIYFFTAFTLFSYLRTPGWYRYFFLAQVWLIFFFVPSISEIAKKLPNKTLSKYGATLAVTGLILVQAGHLGATDLQCSENKVDRGLTYIKSFVLENSNILLINVPELTAQLPTYKYYQYLEINPKIIYGSKNLEEIHDNRFYQIVLKTSEIEKYIKYLSNYYVKDEAGGYSFLQNMLAEK